MERFFSLIQDFDNALLLAVNGLHSDFMDMVMWTYSHRFVWIPLYIFFAFLLFRKYGWRKMILISVMIALTITAADQICATWLRPIFCRPRPGYSEIGGLLHFVDDYRGGSYGFPSCHAANSAALCAYLIYMLRGKTLALALTIWFAVMCYSRMYLGVHYPTDLLFGTLIGGSVGFTFGYLTQRLFSAPIPVINVRASA